MHKVKKKLQKVEGKFSLVLINCFTEFGRNEKLV